MTIISGNDELRECPFCGHKPLLMACDDGGAMIECRTFMCAMEEHLIEGDSDEEAARIWNTRASAAGGVREALERLVNARALSGVRDLVAGWNGEGRADGPYERHPKRLGATLPKTNCGAVYELDEAMQAARAALSASLVQGVQKEASTCNVGSPGAERPETETSISKSDGGVESRVAPLETRAALVGETVTGRTTTEQPDKMLRSESRLTPPSRTAGVAPGPSDPRPAEASPTRQDGGAV